MILDAAWAPSSNLVFATAGREKSVKIWAKDEVEGGSFTCRATIAEEHPVTAIDFPDITLADGSVYLAVGIEAGRVKIYSVYLKKPFSVADVELAYPRYDFPPLSSSKLIFQAIIHTPPNLSRK
jgi:elongator complex protein 2